MVSITHALLQIKTDLRSVLSQERIADLCRQAGHSWRTRLSHRASGRAGRFEPRVMKRRPQKYPWVQKPRRELRKDLLDKDLAA